MIFRKLTKHEEETYGITCSVIRDDNKLLCTRKVQFLVRASEESGAGRWLDSYYCGAHFQELRQLAINGGEELIDLDAPARNATDEIAPP